MEVDERGAFALRSGLSEIDPPAFGEACAGVDRPSGSYGVLEGTISIKIISTSCGDKWKRAGLQVLPSDIDHDSHSDKRARN